MHIISQKVIKDFGTIHPDSDGPLQAWHKVMKASAFQSLVDVRRIFPHADAVGACTVFNIGGNKYRLIAAIHYNRQKVHIRNILTHAEYDKGAWRQKC